MKKLIITILFNTIGCLSFGATFTIDIMFPKMITIIFDFIFFAIFVAAMICCYKYAIKTLKTQIKSEYLDEIRRHFKK